MTRALHRRPTTLLAASGAIVLGGCQTASQRAPLEVETPAIAQTAGDPQVIDRTVRSTIVSGDETLPVGTPGAPAAPPVKRGDISVNLPSADVAVVAKTVLGDILHVPYTIQSGTTGTVSFVTPGPVSRDSLIPLLESALKVGGLALVPQGPGFTISPLQGAVAPIGSDVVGTGSEVVRLQYINAQEFKKVIDPVLPGLVTAISDGENSITLVGTTGQRKAARDLIAQFDVNWLRGMSFGLFVPQRTDARLIVPDLEKLINAPDSPTRGLVRLLAMDRLNGVLAISRQPQYLEDVRRWIEILDREGESSGPRIFVYKVQNGRARDLARTINAAFGNSSGADMSSNSDPNSPNLNAGSSGPATPGSPTTDANRAAPAQGGTNGGSGSANTGPGNSDQARITADEVNNAVVVFGTPQQYAVAEQALRQLDVAPLQVMIEAAITEVSLTDELRFGVQWNFITGQSNFNLTEATAAGPVAPIAPGFSYSYSGNDISAALSALEKRTNLKVVSAPKLLVLNNQTAGLQVGDQVPILTQSATPLNNNNNTIVNSVEYRDTGVILKVTPRVNASGSVQLDVAQEVSDVSNTSSSNINSPTISTRRVSTTIAVQDGQVVAIGGLFRNSQSFGKNGIPILSRIPILGQALFGNRQDLTRRTELIVLLKPHVIHDIEDAKAITEELRARLRTLEPFRTEGRIP